MKSGISKKIVEEISNIKKEMKFSSTLFLFISALLLSFLVFYNTHHAKLYKHYIENKPNKVQSIILQFLK